jgi:6-oxocyclohex-1-ene-carbonyl-CoA hydrolase
MNQTYNHKNHTLWWEGEESTDVDAFLGSVKQEDGTEVDGLYAAYIWMNNEKQGNSYATETLKTLTRLINRASHNPRIVAIIYSGIGTRFFCTGGNVKEYAIKYCGNPDAYATYMDAFSGFLQALLEAHKPTICRVNGDQIGGGREGGMACDLLISGNHCIFGQAGPQVGSCPEGGSVQWLHLFSNQAFAMENLTTCEPIDAYQAKELGLVNEVIPTITKDGRYVVHIDSVVGKAFAKKDGFQIINKNDNIIISHPSYQVEWVDAALMNKAKRGKDGYGVDLTLLDKQIDAYITRFAHTFPQCLRRTLVGGRRWKRDNYLKTSLDAREWLALNMRKEGEASLGMKQFAKGNKETRRIDFIEYRLEQAAIQEEQLGSTM